MDTIEKATVKYDNKYMYISFNYNKECIDELKKATKSRTWRKEQWFWILNVEEREAALKVMRKYFDVIEENKPYIVNGYSVLTNYRGKSDINKQAGNDL